MATPKYFHVRNVPQDKDFLVRATKADLAIAAVDGARAELKPATDQQITDHFTGGGSLHPKSAPEGQGKFFLVPVLADVADALVLVRAKNAQAALLAVNEGVYTAEVATQETLVKLLTRQIVPIDAAPESTKDASRAPEAGGQGGTEGEGEGASTAGEPAVATVNAGQSQEEVPALAEA